MFGSKVKAQSRWVYLDNRFQGYCRDSWSFTNRFWRKTQILCCLRHALCEISCQASQRKKNLLDNFAETIRNMPFFSDLGREDLARVAGKLEQERFASGDIIVKQGDPGDGFYLVQNGAVEVVLEDNGVGESLAMLSTNESFGEMALFTGEKRSATVRAFIDSTVLKLSKRNWEELIGKYPSLTLHFCKILSRRLAETNRDVSRGRSAFSLIMEDFFASQAPEVQDFLVRTSVLKTLEPEIIESAMSVRNAKELLATLSSSFPTFLRVDKKGRYEYRGHVREFLTTKLHQTVGVQERAQLHLGFAAYFSTRAKWLAAIEHYIKAERSDRASELIQAHGVDLLETESPADILAVIKAAPPSVTRSHGPIAQFEAGAHVRVGDLDSAIRSYQRFLSQRQLSTTEIVEVAHYYQKLAELHQQKGEIGQAIGCLRLTATMIDEGKWNLEAVQAMQSIEALQQRSGMQEGALTWSHKALSLAAKLRRHRESRPGLKKQKGFAFLLALAVGWFVWQMPPQPPLDVQGMRFLATLSTAVILWMFDVFDDYVVALTLLPVWYVAGIAPSNMVLAGFSTNSWFFVLAALGMGAAVMRTGLLYRVALQTLKRLPPSYRLYTFMLGISGLIAVPLLPDTRARMAIMAPLAFSISEALGFKPRSNGSAGLVLSTFIGFTQTTFIFLTGATFTLIGWNLLPESAKAEFGWATWTLAALPAGILTLLSLLVAVQILFTPERENHGKVTSGTLETQLEILGPLTKAEWLSLAVLGFAVAGWIAKPLHGIGETWVALAAFLVFLFARVLDKTGLKNSIDWGLLLLVGVLLSLAALIPSLNLDRWLMHNISPALSLFSFHPLPFLWVVALSIYISCFFLRRTAVVILSMLTLLSSAQEIGIHPGVFLLAVLMAVDSWYLPYQSDAYQIAYYSTEEKGFSHSQARKIMVAKCLVSFLAIAVSVPYWQMLGFID